MRLVTAERFEDTAHFRSLEDRFLHGVEWSETELIATLLEVGGDSAWPAFRDPETIRRTCHRLDELYKDIQDRGVISQLEIVRGTGSSKGLLQVMRNEILIDVGRSGEPLFYEGRHRLTIAKLIGVRKVPVAVATWHPDALSSR